MYTIVRISARAPALLAYLPKFISWANIRGISARDHESDGTIY